jgi:HEAT repeat protein
METADKLFLASFEGDEDDERAWSAVVSLRQRDTEEVFQLAVAYCRSNSPKHRARALDVLAQMGAGKRPSERPHFDESVEVAVAHLHDEDPSVVYSAVWALAHLNDDRAITALIEMRGNADPYVRRAVACGMANSARPEAISTLVDLMQDEDDEVRNWSTFQLAQAYVEDGSGRLGTLDSDQIRDAFRKRLNDSFTDVREEAIWGLARRRDPMGLRLLLERLNSERCTQGDAMAAAEALEKGYDTPAEELKIGLRVLIGTL